MGLAPDFCCYILCASGSLWLMISKVKHILVVRLPLSYTFPPPTSHYPRHPPTALPLATVFQSSLTPRIAQNTTTLFNVTTDQQVSSTWYLNGANQNNNTQAWSHTWDIPGQYNVTYVGANGNGSVSIMWNVATRSPFDVDCDGDIDPADLYIVNSNFGKTTYAPYPSYDVIGYGIVDVYDITAVSTNILE
jgi:hypothetical protein